MQQLTKGVPHKKEFSIGSDLDVEYDQLAINLKLLKALIL